MTSAKIRLHVISVSCTLIIIIMIIISCRYVIQRKEFKSPHRTHTITVLGNLTK